MTRWNHALVFMAAALLSACAAPPPTTAAMPQVPTAPTPAGVEVVWLGQAAFKITSPGGKVIVTDPWLRTNPLTPGAYKQVEGFGKIDVLLVSHGHFDRIADAPALAQMYRCRCAGPATCSTR